MFLVLFYTNLSSFWKNVEKEFKLFVVSMEVIFCSNV